MVQREKDKCYFGEQGLGKKEEEHMSRACNFCDEGQGSEKVLKATYFDFLLYTFEFDFFQ